MLDAGVVAEALGAEVTVVDVEGGQRFYVERGEQNAKFDLLGDRIHWQAIQSPGGGWLDEAVEFAKTVAPQHGVRIVTTAAGTDRSREALEARGFRPAFGHLLLQVAPGGPVL